MKEQLLQNEIGPVCARIVGQQDMPLNVATQALRVLMPLSTASCKAGLAADQELVNALVGICGIPLSFALQYSRSLYIRSLLPHIGLHAVWHLA